MTQPSEPTHEAAHDIQVVSTSSDDHVLNELATGILDPSGIGPWPGGGGHPNKYSIPIGTITGLVKPALANDATTEAQAKHEVAAYKIIRALELVELASPTVYRSDLHTPDLGVGTRSVVDSAGG